MRTSFSMQVSSLSSVDASAAVSLFPGYNFKTPIHDTQVSCFLLQCLLHPVVASCREAVYLEKLVKQTGRAVKTSMWVQNMQLVPGCVSPYMRLASESQAAQYHIDENHEAFYSLILTGLTTGASRATSGAADSASEQSDHGIFRGFSLNASWF